MYACLCVVENRSIDMDISAMKSRLFSTIDYTEANFLMLLQTVVSVSAVLQSATPLVAVQASMLVHNHCALSVNTELFPKDIILYKWMRYRCINVPL